MKKRKVIIKEKDFFDTFELKFIPNLNLLMNNYL